MPNQVWCTDLTYSRKVLSWGIPNTMDDSFCVSALESAIRRYGAPGIFNTDQGSPFTGKTFIKVREDNEIKISMDGKGCWVGRVGNWRAYLYFEHYTFGLIIFESSPSTYFNILSRIFLIYRWILSIVGARFFCKKTNCFLIPPGEVIDTFCNTS